MQRLTKSKLILMFILLICFALLISGCREKQTNLINDIGFAYDKDFMPAKRVLRGTLKSQNTTTVSLTRSWGYLDWVPDEGSFIASGEVVARISMDDMEERYTNTDYSLFYQEQIKKKIGFELPQTLSEKDKEIIKQKLSLARGKYEKKWLLAGKEADERQKLKNDARKSIAELKFAEKSFDFQKKITKKGFASPFELRTREIEMKSKKIELDYVDRLENKVDDLPLKEELAKVEHQLNVASGEVWLAENELEAASISFQIRIKSNETEIARKEATHRKIKKVLDQKVIYAARSGIIIHPIVWGQKYGIGSQVWGGVGFVAIVATDSLFLEAVVDEADISALSKGDKATIVFEANPKLQLFGKITSLSKSPRRIKALRGNSKLKKFPVRISVDIGSHSLILGTKAIIEVEHKQQKGIFIPRDIVVKKKKERFVKLKTTFGVKKVKAEISDFNVDWVLWKNAPSEKGVILY